MNFIQLCLSGEVLEEDIDEFIDNWHEGKAGQYQSLHEFLGMSWEEYSIWVIKPSSLPLILSAHRKNLHLNVALN